MSRPEYADLALDELRELQRIYSMFLREVEDEIAERFPGTDKLEAR